MPNERSDDALFSTIGNRRKWRRGAREVESADKPSNFAAINRVGRFRNICAIILQYVGPAEN